MTSSTGRRPLAPVPRPSALRHVVFCGTYVQ
jgi:hypothetical protein